MSGFAVGSSPSGRTPVPGAEGSRARLCLHAVRASPGCLPDLVLLPPQVITNLVKMLKSRDTRRNFCPPNHWLSEQEDIKADKVFPEDLLHIFR